MNNSNNINKTPRSKAGHDNEQSGHAANSVLPLFAAVLNKLQAMGVQCEARASEAGQSLIIEVSGATVQATDEGRIRFVMREQV